MADINPEAWLDGFKKDHPLVQKKITKVSEEQATSSRQFIGAIATGGRLTITPPGAMQILSSMNYDKQRRIDRGHVSTLAEEMRRGLFFGGTQLAFGRLPDDSLHLVNGQHRLQALCEANASVEFQILVVPCANEQELKALYYRFDTVVRRRSGAVIRKTMGFAEEWGIGAQVAGGVWEAGPIILHRLKSLPGGLFEPSLRTPDGRLDAIIPFKLQAKQFNDAIAKATSARRRRLTNAGVVAVALLTLRDQSEKAIPFWTGVAENDGLRQGDPRLALLEYFGNATLLTPNVSISICRNAWNNWFRCKKVRYLKATETDDVTLLGVRF